MDKITVLATAWQQWIQDNLARGCTPQSMLDAMVQNDIDPVVAARAIALIGAGDAGVTALESSGPTPSTATSRPAYRYEASRMTSQGPVLTTTDRRVHVSFRMTQPVVTLLDDMLSHDECDELIRLSRIKLQPSTIVDPTTGRAKVIADRSSEGTFFTLNEGTFIAKLDTRIAQVMNCPVENGEGLQILHYRVGGEYTPHFDYFSPVDLGSQAHLACGGQRVSTLVIYLNDVATGGETVFPELGLSVVPKKGSAVYFEYCNSHGELDPKTLHGGLPVVAGEKWIATKWMRQRRYG
jgi:prolyl 4-hydroxylase